MNQQFYSGTGRRKTAVARVRLYPGGGQAVVVNGKPMQELFTSVRDQEAVLRPLRATDNLDRFTVQARVRGGGVTGWAGAISHGIARALLEADEQAKPTLRRLGLLTRDPRMKERKKYGLKRARKAPQYTKR
jgi:small subunit ribosomal protein S9